MPARRQRLAPYRDPRTGLWVARMHNPAFGIEPGAPRYLILGSFKRRGDAQLRLDAYYDELARPTKPMSVRSYFAGWTTNHPRSKVTNKTNEGRINAVIDVEIEPGLQLGDMVYRDLHRGHAPPLIAHMLVKQGRTVNGVRAILRALSAMTTDAIDDHMAEVNPFLRHKIAPDDPRIQKRPKPKSPAWIRADMHEFAAAAGSYEAMVRVLSDCGLRLGELFALRVEFQNYAGGWLAVRGSIDRYGNLVHTSREKNHHRDVPLPPSTAALLAAIPIRLGCPWIFYTPGLVVAQSPGTAARAAEARRLHEQGISWKRIAAQFGVSEGTVHYWKDLQPKPARTRGGGQRWLQRNFYRDVWDPIVEKIGRRVTPQEFRASWETDLRERGYPEDEIALYAGHSRRVADEHYVRPRENSAEAIRQALG